MCCRVLSCVVVLRYVVSCYLLLFVCVCIRCCMAMLCVVVCYRMFMHIAVLCCTTRRFVSSRVSVLLCYVVYWCLLVCTGVCDVCCCASLWCVTL